MNLHKLIKNSDNRRRKKGFEEIKRVKIKGKSYFFWIPFLIIQKQVGNSNTQISFQVKETLNFFPHFGPLKGENFPLTRAYDNVLEIKRIINKDFFKLKSILELKEKELKRIWVLKKTEENDLLTPKTLDLDEDEILGSFSEEKVQKKREQFNISNFKEESTEELNKKIKSIWIRIPKQFQDKKGLLVSTLVEAMALANEKGKLSEEDKLKLNRKIKKNLIDLSK